MKIRTGFVSNSSSASFVVKFKSEYSRSELATFMRKANYWLDRWWDVSERKEIDWTKGLDSREKRTIQITPIGEEFLVDAGNGHYMIKPDVNMMNNWTDIPAWQFIRALYEDRVPNTKLIENRQVYDEYSECDVLIDKIDTNCWEYKQCILNPYENMDPNDADEAIELQEEIEYDYLKFLSDINSPLSEEETILLTKQHLNNM